MLLKFAFQDFLVERRFKNMTEKTLERAVPFGRGKRNCSIHQVVPQIG
jgi:hypothetical protein